MKNSTYQDRVDRIIAKDQLTVTNMKALYAVTGERYRNAETPADEERATIIADNINSWLIKVALRRHRKEVAAATGPLNNTLAALTIGRIKARRFNGSKG